jgi:hypothetical protein
VSDREAKRVVTKVPRLWKTLAVSVLSVWASSFACFYLLEFRDRLLYRTLGTSLTFLLAGLAYPLIAALPLSRLVSRRSTKSFVVAFFIAFVVAVAVLAVVFKAVGGLLGAYGGGFLAIWFLGSALGHYLNSDGPFIRDGGLLACWALTGDYLGYSARGLAVTLGGVMVYASINSLFLGSGLGTLLWHVQRTGRR